MNPLIVVSCFVSAAATLLVAAAEIPAVTLFTAALALVNLFGAIAIVAGDRKHGAWCVLLASAPLVPIGFLGMLGARRVLDQVAKEEFERALAARK